MPHLRVLVGPDPDHVQLVAPGQPIHIRSELFEGEITVFLQQTDMNRHPIAIENGHERSFCFQVDGHFKPVNQRELASGQHNKHVCLTVGIYTMIHSWLLRMKFKHLI
jgi:hypothetical protein